VRRGFRSLCSWCPSQNVRKGSLKVEGYAVAELAARADAVEPGLGGPVGKLVALAGELTGAGAGQRSFDEIEQDVIVQGREVLRAVLQYVMDRPGPVPGPALYRDRPPHRAGHGRPGDLRHHRRTRTRPHRYPGSAAPRARPAAARRARDDPADRPGDRTSPRRPPQPVMPARPCRSLAGLATPPPGPLPVVSSAHPARPRKCPGQLAIGGRRAGGAMRPVCLAFRLPRCALTSVDSRSVVKSS